MYVDLIVNGKPIRAMVDTGASHNYVSEAEATNLKIENYVL
jgi:predicted aspartyl protease